MVQVMCGMNSPVEEIKSRLDLVEFIQSYIRLQKAGINYRANCPFHTEKTPSFFVSPTRQIWHCFGGCQKGGDIFKFVMEVEGLDFPEALRLLAGRAGVVLKREDPTIRSERNRLYDLCEEAAKVFEKSLELTLPAKNYLLQRGLRQETMKEFRLGFAPQSWDFLLRALASHGFKKEEMEKAGLVIKSEDKSSWYDRFRSRIMFPITDANSRVVGFGGRIFALSSEVLTKEGGKSSSAKATEDVAKYVNTPNTMTYDKSRILYGFDKAKQEIRTQNRVVLVEGYMDCIMSHQAGVQNTVAVSGTAFTTQQLKILRRLCDTLVCSFDTDEAGDSATKRSLALAAEFEFDRRIVLIPSGKDPADTVKESSEAWQKAVLEAKPVVEFYFEKALRNFNPASADGKKSISAILLPYIAELASEIEKAHWVGRLGTDLGISEEAIWREIRRTKKNTDGGQSRNTEEGTMSLRTRRDLIEERLLSLLTIFDKEKLPLAWKGKTAVLSTPFNQELFNMLISGTSSASLPAHLTERANLLHLQGEIIAERTEDLEKELTSCFYELECEDIRGELKRLNEEISMKEKGGRQEEVAPLLESFRTLSRRLKSSPSSF